MSTDHKKSDGDQRRTRRIVIDDPKGVTNGGVRIITNHHLSVPDSAGKDPQPVAVIQIDSSEPEGPREGESGAFHALREILTSD
jgi:hypothetical protein